MAGSRKRNSGARRKKRAAGTGGRILLLLLVLVFGGVVFWQRAPLVTGIQVHVLGGRGVQPIRAVADLDRARGIFSPLVNVTGIPDYEHRLRFPAREGTLTCFRMIGFETRLFVCSEGDLKMPEAIQDVLRERSFSGRLEDLKHSRFGEPLTRGFARTYKIHPASDAGVVRVGRLQAPSLAWTLALAGCLMLCFFFLLLFIKTFRG